ncbi:MAG: hypothetical protein E4H14_09365 [Candidatus Thorarchaeota archaeon]|nr:MAG: hypothetical protein E4H14_09365 [Candidatus Thorarchaeota archaeon]
MPRALIELGVEYNANRPPVRTLTAVDLEHFSLYMKQKQSELLVRAIINPDIKDVFKDAVVIVDLTNYNVIKNCYAIEPRDVVAYCKSLSDRAELVSSTELLERTRKSYLSS